MPLKCFMLIVILLVDCFGAMILGEKKYRSCFAIWSSEKERMSLGNGAAI